MKGNCFPFILIILIIFGCIFVKKGDQIKEAFGGLKEGFREGQGTFNVRIGSNYRNAPKTVRNVIPAGQTVRFLLNPNQPTPQQYPRAVVNGQDRRWRDRFRVVQQGRNVLVTRLDGYNTWGQNLILRATRTNLDRSGGGGPWRKCADENGRCTGNGYVRYGKGATWSTRRLMRGRINCNNGTFGDPLVGTRKECQLLGTPGGGGGRGGAAQRAAAQRAAAARAAARGGGGAGCVTRDVVRVNGTWRNCCVRCGTGYSATSRIGDGGRCLTCGVARPPPPPRKCSSYGCPCGYINNGEQQCANNRCTQTQCCSRVPKETIPHCISQLSWGRNCAKCDPEGWELSNAPKRVEKKVSGGGDRWFRPNGVLDPKTWTKCADRNGRCTVKDSRGKYWFRTSQGGGWSSSREWTAQEKTGGIICNAPSCQKAMEGGAIHDKGKHVAKNSGAQPTCGSQKVPSPPPPPDCFKQVAPSCKRIAQIPIDNCIKQRDWGKSCNTCAVGYKMSSDKTRCDLIPIPNCKNQEREVCVECEEPYRIGKTGRTCDRIPKEKIPHCTNQRDWGAYCYECGDDQSGYMTSEDKSKCIPRPISNCKDQEGIRCNRCRFGYTKSLDWKSCDIVAIKNCAIQNKTICTECKMGYRMGEDRRKCDLLPISNCQARYEAFKPGQGFGKGRVFSKAS